MEQINKTHQKFIQKINVQRKKFQSAQGMEWGRVVAGVLLTGFVSIAAMGTGPLMSITLLPLMYTTGAIKKAFRFGGTLDELEKIPFEKTNFDTLKKDTGRFAAKRKRQRRMLNILDNVALAATAGGIGTMLFATLATGGAGLLVPAVMTIVGGALVSEGIKTQKESLNGRTTAHDLCHAVATELSYTDMAAATAPPLPSPAKASLNIKGILAKTFGKKAKKQPENATPQQKTKSKNSQDNTP